MKTLTDFINDEIEKQNAITKKLNRKNRIKKTLIVSTVAASALMVAKRLGSTDDVTSASI